MPEADILVKKHSIHRKVSHPLSNTPVNRHSEALPISNPRSCHQKKRPNTTNANHWTRSDANQWDRPLRVPDWRRFPFFSNSQRALGQNGRVVMAAMLGAGARACPVERNHAKTRDPLLPCELFVDARCPPRIRPLRCAFLPYPRSLLLASPTVLESI